MIQRIIFKGNINTVVEELKQISETHKGWTVDDYIFNETLKERMKKRFKEVNYEV